MSNFSDSHETVENPITSANHHRLLLPQQSQVWAVLRERDSLQRLTYSLCSTFLGCMCLSGDINRLNDEQWEIILRAQNIYRLAGPVIKNGSSRRFGTIGPSWRHPTGWQAVLRVSDDRLSALVVAHAFKEAPEKVTLDLPEGAWALTHQFPHETACLDRNRLTVSFAGEFSAQTLLLHLAEN